METGPSWICLYKLQYLTMVLDLWFGESIAVIIDDDLEIRCSLCLWYEMCLVNTCFELIVLLDTQMSHNELSFDISPSRWLEDDGSLAYSAIWTKQLSGQPSLWILINFQFSTNDIYLLTFCGTQIKFQFWILEVHFLSTVSWSPID